jgi:asparagine synthase (glutamine-hydrolysing)
MIELRAAVCSRPDNCKFKGFSGDSGSNRRPHYSRDYAYANVFLQVEGDDSRVELLGFSNAEVSVVCRTDLLQEGQRNHEQSDSAAYVASLYLQQGDDFIRSVRGSFAIILYDHRARALKAWTDHFGIQRLLYAQRPDGLSIATDLRLLTDAANEIDPTAIVDYLQYSCIPGPKTIYRGCFKLLPGHQLTFDRRCAIRPYWDMAYRPRAGRDDVSWAQETTAAVRSAVARNLSSLDARRVGCFLSGGTDSSSVSGLTGQLVGAPPRTFSIGFDDPRYNEIEYARIAARYFQAEHHEYFVTPEDIPAVARKAAVAYDEPFGNSSVIPTYYCARLAAEHGVTHLLAGDGGDELFGGNARYADDRVFQRYRRIPAWARKALIEPCVAQGSRWMRNGFFERASSYVRRSNIDAPDRYFSYFLVNSVAAGELFHSDFADARAVDRSLDRARDYFRSAPARDELNRWLYLDLKIVITDNDIRKVTTMSQVAGVTVRYPLLDPQLAEFSGTIPADLKVRGRQLRYIFKKAMRGLLPPEIITKRKHGFGLPYSVWLGENKPLRDFTFDILGSTRARQRGYFRRDLPEWLWNRYQIEHRGYYGEMLWVFLMLELWHVTQADHSGSRTPALASSTR